MAKVFLTDKSERTFNALLDSAVSLFQEQGYEATSMRDISKASGLALGAIYYYCHSKEELVLLFYEKINRQIAASYAQRRRSTSNLGDLFIDFMRLKMSKLAKYKKLLIVVLKESVDPESPISPLSNQSSEVRDDNVDLFKSLILTCDNKSVGVDENARFLWLMHMGILMFWLYDRSKDGAATEKLLHAVGSLIAVEGKLQLVPGFREVIAQLKSSVLSIIQ